MLARLALAHRHNVTTEASNVAFRVCNQSGTGAPGAHKIPYLVVSVVVTGTYARTTARMQAESIGNGRRTILGAAGYADYS